MVAMSAKSFYFRDLRFLCAVVPAFLLSGCLAIPIPGQPEPYRESVVEFLIIGETNKQEVRSRFDEAKVVYLRGGSVWVLSSQQRLMNWLVCFGGSYYAACSELDETREYESHYLITQFDSNDRLSGWSRADADPADDPSFLIGVEYYDLDIISGEDEQFSLTHDGQVVATAYFCGAQICSWNIANAKGMIVSGNPIIRFKNQSDLLLALQLHRDGSYQELYFGEAEMVRAASNYRSKLELYEIDAGKLMAIGRR